MQTDLQTLLSITGVVCGTYIISNLMRRKRNIEIFDQGSELDLDEQSVSQRYQADPLLDVTDELLMEKQEISPSVYDHAMYRSEGIVGQPRKVIIDDSVAESLLSETQLNDEMDDISTNPAVLETNFIALTVIAKKDRPFSGDLLFNALKANHLYYGKDKVFHRHVNDNPMQNPIYSALSLVNPGYFDIDTMSQDEFRGIVLLMTLSNRTNPLITFEKMLTNARQLAVSLGGELCDAGRRPLTAQMMAHVRETIQKNHRKSLTQTTLGVGVI